MKHTERLTTRSIVKTATHIQFMKPYLLLVALTLLLCSCNDPDAPAPCADLPLADTLVKIYNTGAGIAVIVEYPEQLEYIRKDGDSTLLGTIEFSVPTDVYDSVQWRVGTNPEVFTQNKFRLFFDTDTGPIRVQFVGFRQPADPRCNSNDTGRDTVVRHMRLLADEDAPILGKFWGALDSAPLDSFEINTLDPSFLLPSVSYIGGTYCAGEYIRAYRQAFIIFHLAYPNSGLSSCVWDINARIGLDRQSIVFEYTYMDRIITGPSTTRSIGPATQIFRGKRRN
jgi:hypothetical protein